jgi:hypothetical protein
MFFAEGLLFDVPIISAIAIIRGTDNNFKQMIFMFGIIETFLTEAATITNFAVIASII